MKKLLLAVAFAVTIALPLTAALATPPPGGPPGQGECEHGNSGQTCVPDPQPTHGQDCEEHGPNEGGVNEDHCLSTSTSTTTPVTTTVTSPPTTTTVTSTTETDTTTTSAVPSTEPPTTVTEPAGSTTTGVVSTTVTAPPSETVTLPPAGGGSDSGSDRPEKPGKLAFTGIEDIVPWGIAALVLLTIGSGLFWLGRNKVSE